jgi:membrane protease YdiL (CAAX protease family)
MQYRSIKGFSIWAQIGLLIGLLGAGLIFAGIGQAMVLAMMGEVNLMEGLSTEKLMDALLKPENTFYVRLMNAVGTFFIMCLPALAFTYLVNGKNLFWLGFNKWFGFPQLLIGAALIFLTNLLAVPFMEITKSITAHFPSLNELATSMEAEYDQQIKAISNLQTWNDYGWSLLFMALLPALFEEMFFRGTIQSSLERWTNKPIWAIVITSIIFSLIHASIFLFLSRFLLGVALGFIFYKTRNLWVCVFVHFFNNAMAATQMFWLSKAGEEVRIDEMDPSVPIWLIVPIALAIVGGFYLLNKQSFFFRRGIEDKEQTLLQEATVDNPFK